MKKFEVIQELILFLFSQFLEQAEDLGLFEPLDAIPADLFGQSARPSCGRNLIIKTYLLGESCLDRRFLEIHGI